VHNASNHRRSHVSIEVSVLRTVFGHNTNYIENGMSGLDRRVEGTVFGEPEGSYFFPESDNDVDRLVMAIVATRDSYNAMERLSSVPRSATESRRL